MLFKPQPQGQLRILYGTGPRRCQTNGIAPEGIIPLNAVNGAVSQENSGKRMNGFEGWTILMKAVDTGDEKAVMRKIKRLLKKDGKINAQSEDGRGWTALMIAAMNGNKRLVNILLENGADSGIRDKGGWTAEIHASDMGYNEIAKIIAAWRQESQGG